LVLEARSRGAGGALSYGELRVLVHGWRDQGRSIVLTNGCFDLFHDGHVALLRAAAAEGDVLVVAVDSDSSVAALKGPGRPVVGEGERARVLAAVHDVDAVVLFESAALLELIRVVRPDVLVKGADYRLDEVIGRELVEGYGGRIVLVPLVEGLSTSHRIQAIQPHDR
jgi:D-beta-D-heptose 7-phosphate kinase/D-beta-D-heptose 1-phosphate adenosyltransferase